VLGYSTLQNFQPVEDTTAIAPPQSNIDDLISTAFSMRPEILSLEFQAESAQKFQNAERDLFFSNVQALGVVGDTPVRNPIISSSYWAVGVNVEIPIFNGFLYSARAREATFKAQAAQERLPDRRDTVSRDVRTSWLNAKNAYDRLAVTQQFVGAGKSGAESCPVAIQIGTWFNCRAKPGATPAASGANYQRPGRL
jgi:outer membrane protein